jgi:hypothetical protein
VRTASNLPLNLSKTAPMALMSPTTNSVLSATPLSSASSSALEMKAGEMSKPTTL